MHGVTQGCTFSDEKSMAGCAQRERTKVQGRSRPDRVGHWTRTRLGIPGNGRNHETCWVGQRTRVQVGIALALALAGAGCSPPGDGGDDARDSVSAIDDVGRAVRLEQPARRVISLVPAGTETLFALGAGDRVVGRTRYDVDDAVAHLPSVGGGLDPSLEAIVALAPDLVVAFETASESRIRPRIESLGIPVFA